MFQLMGMYLMNLLLLMVCLKDQSWTTFISVVYINDLASVSKFLTFYLFADDTNIYSESSDLLTIQKIVNRELHKIRK